MAVNNACEKYCANIPSEYLRQCEMAIAAHEVQQILSPLVGSVSCSGVDPGIGGSYPLKI